MLQLDNDTGYEALISPLPDADGVDTLYVIVKGTYSLAGSPQLLDKQQPITMADEYLGEPGQSSLRYASEMHLTKPATDVALVGQAWAPKGRPVPQVDVDLSVGGRSKTVRVFGDRSWKGGFMGLSVSDPKPFESMPLVWERAYGGVHREEPESDVALAAEERNPVGVGFLGKRKAKEMDGQPLPNLEDPKQTIRKPGEKVTPVGFGFVAPNWLPRREFAGTYDEAWQTTRMPLLPEDFDPRFFNAAPPDLVFEGYLKGGEPVQIRNVSPDGGLRFKIPRCRAELEVAIAGELHEPELHLETVLIEPDEDRLCLTWRAAVRCDKKTLRVRTVRVRSASE